MTSARLRPWLVLALSGLTVGCNVAGPAALRNGRSNYNSVINQTEDEQILSMIVRERYDETFGMLAVSSVTANIRIGASAGGNVGIGADESYAGNLVPLSGTATYEENPTISYVPLRGEQFVERTLTPISLEHALLLSRASTEEMEAFRIVVRRANGLTNPLYATPATTQSTGFDRFVDLYTRLRERGVLDVVRSKEGVHQMLLHNYADDDAPQVRELLDTLGIPADLSKGERIFVPMTFSVGAPTADGLDLETPSVLDVIRAAAIGIDVPRAHLASGIARPSGGRALADRNRFIAIRSSTSRPRDAVVAVAHKGWWFSIDARDARSKQGFMFLRILVGMRLDRPDAGQQTPVLTVPVSG